MNSGPTTYQQFRSLASKYDPTVLLPKISALSWGPEGLLPATRRKFYPWVLAEMARECLAQPIVRARRGPVTLSFLSRLHRTGFNLWDPALEHVDIDRIIDDLSTRAQFQQFFFQALDHLSELGRLLELFAGGDTAYKALNLSYIREQSVADVLGMPLEELVKAVFILNALAATGQGQVDLPQVERTALEAVGVAFESFEHVLTDYMASELSELRKSAKAGRNTDPALRRFDFNPLMNRPYVRIGDNRLVAPVREYADNRIGLSSLLFKARQRLEKPEIDQFQSDVGRLVEAYVGRQLAQLNGLLIRERPYRSKKQRKDTCDWILVIGGITIIIEVKVASVTHGAKLDFDQYTAAVERDIGKALGKQLGATAELIRSDHDIFADVQFPKNIYGMVVTAERFFNANSPRIRETLANEGRDPGIPFTVLSLAELEEFVACVLAGANPVALIRRFSTLQTIPHDDMKRYRDLRNLEIKPNPLLVQHFERITQGFFDEAAAYKSS